MVDIRSVDGQEMLDILYRLDGYAFRPTPPFPVKSEWEARILAREGPAYYAVFEESEAVAIAACPRLTQNVRGSLLKMAGYAAVSTHPKARRRGCVRALLRYAHIKNREEGRAVSCLYPFRESFYERLGYVTFPQQWQAVFQAQSLVPLFKMGLTGSCELNLSGQAYPAYREFLLDMQASTHGMGLFEDSQEKAAQDNRSWVLLAKVDGKIDGVMVYAIRGDEMMNYTLQASRFYYRSVRGRYLLLEWLARHVDQAGNARLWLAPSEQPNTWMSDLRPKLEPVFVAPMGRVLDVSGIDGLTTGPGRFTAQISDPDCPWNEGPWCFESDAGRLVVKPGSEPDCDLTIQGLSALIYGVNDPAEYSIRGWGNPSADVAQIMRAMFPSCPPYLHEQY